MQIYFLGITEIGKDKRADFLIVTSIGNDFQISGMIYGVAANGTAGEIRDAVWFEIRKHAISEANRIDAENPELSAEPIIPVGEQYNEPVSTPSKVIIQGPELLRVYDVQQIVKYSAHVIDQYGEQIYAAVTWSVSGATIDSNGFMLIYPTATGETQTVTIQAMADGIVDSMSVVVYQFGVSEPKTQDQELIELKTKQALMQAALDELILGGGG
ncbi:hypothetical protein [Cohnella herbarum]|uniref:BIG2 domain-containing protein n=1 Tax=Cohnella herbarum TaxID=2728023 RepID=A0A7Z2ZNX2_9BACL|nr:hypothetical protein [Cohnella herbarum]QJD86723.1 hypothetical protein HH215_28505 [Cohnella herbarum]